MIKLASKENRFGGGGTDYSEDAWHYRRLNSLELGTCIMNPVGFVWSCRIGSEEPNKAI
jgi:hypothetical protein